jgi:hypothetical protein
MSAGASLDPASYAEVLGRLVSLRQAIADLAAAYDDPIAKHGAEEMQASLDRVLQLLGHRE